MKNALKINPSVKKVQKVKVKEKKIKSRECNNAKKMIKNVIRKISS